MPMRSPRPESWGRLTPYYPWQGNQGRLDRLRKIRFLKGTGFTGYRRAQDEGHGLSRAVPDLSNEGFGAAFVNDHFTRVREEPAVTLLAAHPPVHECLGATRAA
jgi:hypothetical protein